MEYEKKLDALLRYLLKTEIHNSQNVGTPPYDKYAFDIIEELKLNDHDEFIELIEILFEDKFILCDFINIGMGMSASVKVVEKAKITTKGKISISRGGYEKQYLLEKRDSYVKKRNDLLLTPGSVGAGAYGIFEIFRFLLTHLAPCCHP